jgi:hypothetical protein
MWWAMRCIQRSRHQDRLAYVIYQNNIIIEQGRRIMSAQDDFSAAMQRLSDQLAEEAKEVDAVKATVDAIKAQAQNGLDPSQVVAALDGVTAKLAAQNQRLQDMAAAAEPTPPAPPLT